MDVSTFLLNTQQVVASLQQRLFTPEQAPSMVDLVEGHQPQARRSAVLLPLFEFNGKPHLLFIRRAATLRMHAGEVAFPGGRAEPDDSSLLRTALRETYEEVGIPPERVVPLGMLSPVFTVVSNFIITPVVGFLPDGPGPLRVQTDEVAETIFAPLVDLADPAIARSEQWGEPAHVRTVYFYSYGTYQIWGATGRILKALLETLSLPFPH